MFQLFNASLSNVFVNKRNTSFIYLPSKLKIVRGDVNRIQDLIIIVIIIIIIIIIIVILNLTRSNFEIK